MSDLIFNFCILFVCIGAFALMFGVMEFLFNLAEAKIPAFRKWVNDFIGEDDWESEV